MTGTSPPREVIVLERRDEAEGVIGVILGDSSGAALPAWEPGAHIDVLAGPDLVRQYSLCGSPGDTFRYRLGILREPNSRGGSEHLHAGLAVGDRVNIVGPRNHFELVDAEQYLFIAGGIGITPLIPMIEHADRRGAEWRLLYGGRNRASIAFAQELATYGDRVQVVPQDECGHPDIRTAYDRLPETGEVYCCGPEALITAVQQHHNRQGRPASKLHIERFSKTTAATDTRDDRDFEVWLEESRITVAVPSGRTILECVRDAGVDASSSCEEGICGECETAVLDGTPDHRDSLLTDAERAAGNTMMICCSRAITDRLVLQL
jgi:ferredoxin-NADP reductase